MVALRRHFTLFAPFILSAGSCSATPVQVEAGQGKSGGGFASEFIGVATQEADGTIALQYRAEGPNGAIGDGLKRYTPNDPDYQAVKDHIGPIPKDGSVQVRPFPAQQPQR